MLTGIIVLLVCSCSSKKLENLGLSKKKASEYAIARNVPLVMPPDMLLSPPEKEKKLKKINLKKNEVVTLDDILLDKDVSFENKNKSKRKKKKKLYNKEKIVERILRAKAAIVLN